MRFLIGMILFLSLVTWSFANQTWTHTDIDSAFMKSDYHNTSPYRAKCKKPKEFRGLGKFKVSCYEYPFDEFGISSLGPRHFSNLRYWGWTGIGTVAHTDDAPEIDNWTHRIIVLEKRQYEYPNCNRRIFMSFSADFNQTLPLKGDTVYFADPRKLYCKG